jgi:hypothetical protein
MKRLEPHPLAQMFPAIPPDEMAQVVADIKKHGVIEPIWMYEGKVLDGWHRYQAAIKAGKEPKVREWKGDDPMAFIVSMNIMRRHLIGEQRAATMALAAKKLGVLKRGPQIGQGHSDVGVRTDDVANAANVHPRVASRAIRVADADPNLAGKVAGGQIGLTEADQIIARKERKAAGKPPIEEPRTYKPKPELAVAMRQLVNAVRDLLKLELAPEDKRFVRAKLTELMEKMR